MNPIEWIDTKNANGQIMIFRNDRMRRYIKNERTLMRIWRAYDRYRLTQDWTQAPQVKIICSCFD